MWCRPRILANFTLAGRPRTGLAPPTDSWLVFPADPPHRSIISTFTVVSLDIHSGGAVSPTVDSESLLVDPICRRRSRLAPRAFSVTSNVRA